MSTCQAFWAYPIVSTEKNWPFKQKHLNSHFFISCSVVHNLQKQSGVIFSSITVTSCHVIFSSTTVTRCHVISSSITVTSCHAKK